MDLLSPDKPVVIACILAWTTQSWSSRNRFLSTPCVLFQEMWCCILMSFLLWIKCPRYPAVPPEVRCLDCLDIFRYIQTPKTGFKTPLGCILDCLPVVLLVMKHCNTSNCLENPHIPTTDVVAWTSWSLFVCECYWMLPSLKLTVRPWKQSPNHQFSEAMLVSGMVSFTLISNNTLPSWCFRRHPITPCYPRSNMFQRKLNLE